MVSVDMLKQCVGRLSLLRRFPSNDYALAEIGKMLNDLCPDDAAAVALVDHVLRQWNDWEGPAAFRHASKQLHPIDTMDPATKRAIEERQRAIARGEAPEL